MRDFLPDWYLAASAFVLGTVVGSFANVVIYRLPKDLSLGGRSACPHCGNQIAWYDNIPLVSYLVLRGRCRVCRAPIGLRYPLVELVVGLLWLLFVWRLGFRPILPALLAFASTLVILSAIDLEHHRLPNKILFPAALVAIVLLVIGAVAQNDWQRLLESGLGALAYGVPILAVGLAFPAGMGGGDIKLAAYLGLHLGWFGLWHVLVGALLGILLGGLSGTALLLFGIKGRKDPIPFGPFMALGAIVSVLAGSKILDFWLG